MLQIPYPDVTDDVCRSHFFKQDRAQCRKFVRIMMLAQVPLAYLDYFIFANNSLLLISFSIRLVVLVYAMQLLRILNRVPSVARLQRQMLIWIGVSLGAQLLLDSLTPSNYLGHYLIDSWWAMMYFIAIPLPLRHLRIPVTVFVMAALGLLAFKLPPSVGYAMAVLIMLPVSSYSGYGIAQYMQRYRRKILSAEHEMDKRAHTDPVTGVATRAEFIRVSDIEIHRHVRFGKPLSVLVLDLAHLKSISDTYGPQASDVVLVEVSRRIKRATRSYDFVARYGTDEFCILLPDATQHDVDSVVNRIRSNVVSMPISFYGRELKVHAYTGVASLSEGDNVTQILKRADAELVRAKQENETIVVNV
jgi:diguanylate cyclase (GGDEF)-like protein